MPDALVLQGFEAGGHRGSFDDLAPQDLGLLTLLRLVAAITDIPLIASGGLFDGAGIAAVLVAGAAAAQLGTAFMLCPEAATSPAHRGAIESETETDLSRAFTGRRAHVRSRSIPAARLMDVLAEEARAALASAPRLRAD